MFSFLLEVPDEAKDVVVAELWEHGTTGVLEQELPGGQWRLEAFFEGDGAAAAVLLDAFARFGAELQRQPQSDTDWVKVFRDSWQPFPVGQSWYLAPYWHTGPTPASRTRLDIHPGLAYGTGIHPSTQLCLEALESHVPAGKRVLDLGTGSGILAAAAVLKGAEHVFACDIDPEAVPIGRQNLAGYSEQVDFFVGSTRCVASQSVEVVVANINAETIARLAGEIRRVLRPGGTAIFSGFRSDTLSRVLKSFPQIPPREKLEQDDWHCLVY